MESVSAASPLHLCPGRRTWLGLLLQACIGAAWSQEDVGADELHVKAAFLYRFTGYVDWPDNAFASAGTPFTMGVLGADSVYAELAQIAIGRKVHERAIAVRKLAPGEATSGLHLLFAGRGAVPRPEPARPLLVVTEVDGEMPRGSMINFRLFDRHVRFDIALDVVETAGLHMSSRLLAVAQKIYRAGGG